MCGKLTGDGVRGGSGRFPSRLTAEGASKPIDRLTSHIPHAACQQSWIPSTGPSEAASVDELKAMLNTVEEVNRRMERACRGQATLRAPMVRFFRRVFPAQRVPSFIRNDYTDGWLLEASLFKGDGNAFQRLSGALHLVLAGAKPVHEIDPDPDQ
jgi:hypothetical protein